jgi:hypothetical protein
MAGEPLEASIRVSEKVVSVWLPSGMLDQVRSALEGSGNSSREAPSRG